MIHYNDEMAFLVLAVMIRLTHYLIFLHCHSSTNVALSSDQSGLFIHGKVGQTNFASLGWLMRSASAVLPCSLDGQGPTDETSDVAVAVHIFSFA